MPRLSKPILGLCLLSAALLLVTACGKKESKKPDPDVVAKKALPGFAEAATAHFKRNGSKFIQTTVMVFCRTGNSLHRGKLAALGYKASDAEKELSFCYNVADNLKKVALSVSTEEDESRWCLVLDGTSGTVKRGSIEKKKGCRP